MELNRKVTRSGDNLVINPEGGIVFKEKDDKSLFLNASALRLRNSFYWNAKETLKAFEELVDVNRDFKYKMAVAKFLSKMLGIRLSPVIIATREAMKLKPVNHEFWMNDVSIDDAREYVKDVTNEIMDRPDKITNALAYAQYHWGEFRSLPPFYKKVLRNALERFDAYSLRKFKLKRRAVKMADAIKTLRPRPRDDEMAELYKAIIENSPEAAIEDDAVITQVLSDTKKTKEEKKEWVEKNIENLPFNALIRNLRNVPYTKKNAELLKRRLSRALRTEAGLPVVKIANPFDILSAGLNSGYEEFMEVVDEALGEFLTNIELVDNGTKVTFLVDISGSMSSYWNNEGGINIAAEYFALLYPTLKNAEITQYAFNTRISNRSGKVALYRRNIKSPVTIKSLFFKDFKTGGGTSLAGAVRKVVKLEAPDLLIVLSDDVSWADQKSNRVFNVGCNVIAINPYPQGNFTVFSQNIPVIKISSLDAKIFYYIPLMANFGKFKNWIKNWAFGGA